MSKAVIFVEQRDGKLKKTSFELIGAAKEAGCETHAVLIGEGVSGLVDEVSKYGADSVFVADSPNFKNYTAESYSKALTQVCETAGATFVLASHTPMGKDLLPHVAFNLNAGLASDCTSVSFNGDQVTAKRPVYAGKATVEVEFLGSGPKVLTVRPNSLKPPQENTGASANKQDLSVDLGDQKTKCTAVEKGNNTRPDVTEASVVVSGGRSLKSADNFAIIEKLADTMGAAVGASRAAVDAGFRPHRDQVGQTGKVVSPSLYIACGISGAIQHLAGMRTSKVIVAVNTDPEAPIFQVADYGVVADLFEFVPALTEEIGALKS